MKYICYSIQTSIFPLSKANGCVASCWISKCYQSGVTNLPPFLLPPPPSLPPSDDDDPSLHPPPPPCHVAECASGGGQRGRGHFRARLEYRELNGFWLAVARVQKTCVANLEATSLCGTVWCFVCDAVSKDWRQNTYICGCRAPGRPMPCRARQCYI